MNISALETFLAIVETGSLVRASERLNVTQSTVTARLKKLEEGLGQPLLHRQKSGATLTPAGTRLLSYAQVMTGLWRQARLEAGLPTGISAICNLGCHPELWPGRGQAFFAHLAAVTPALALSVNLGSDADLRGWLEAGRIDIALGFDGAAGRGQRVHDLPPEDLVLYSNRADTPVKGDARYTFVDHGPEYRRAHGESYFDAGTARITFNASTPAMAHLRAAGGSAYLTRSVVEAEPGAGLVALRDAPVFQRRAFLILAEAQAANWGWLPGAIAGIGAAG